ncbi:MAG TPA: hypothetical protein VI915_01925 [Thermoplasmata archaeon]|nr:hypothetical protein [Thermoplasmata archaeon]
MSDRFMENAVGKRRRTRGGAAVVLILLAVGLAGMPYLARPATAGVLDPHVVAFAASPSYINLAMTTTVTVEIGSSYGAGLDNYLATAFAPGGGTATAWYNFTAVGVLSVVYGDATSGFNASVGLVGTYELQLEYFNGTAFSLAAVSQFSATDQLLVDTEAATASNEYTDVHNCPIAQEFQRGGEIIARAYVRYASTGDFVNGTQTPSARGNITGTLLGLTKVLTWQNVYHFWRNAWFPTWNESIGVVVFTATASDGRGNSGIASSQSFGLTAWKIIPAILKVVPQIVNDTGAETVSFVRGDNLTVRVRVTYEGHNAHNRAFPGPMNGTRGGVVTAVLGYGAYNATSGQFQYPLTSVTLALDPTTQNWSATYQVRSTDPIRTDLQAVVSAHDAAPATPNTGMAYSTRFSIRAPVTTPPPVTPAPSGLDPIVAGFAAVVALVAGLGIGLVVARRRRSKPAQGQEPAEEDEDEWVVEDEKEGKQ